MVTDRHNGSVDLDSVADELYALPLADFTGGRNAYAKRARAEGDRALAGEIQQLGKPTTAAWLVNQLSRRLGAELEPLIDLGRDLRQASANVSGEELRALTRQRHQVVSALVQQVRRLGAEDGARVSDGVAEEVRRTLDASLADPEVAEAVMSGRLSRPVEYAGFGEPAGVSWHPGAQRAGAQRAGATSRTRRDRGSADAEEVADLTARRRESAEQALTQAADELRDAQRAREEAERVSEQASAEQQTAALRAQELRADLEEAERRAAAAGEAAGAARERLEHADRVWVEAERAHRRAEGDLAEVAGLQE